MSRGTVGLTGLPVWDVDTLSFVPWDGTLSTGTLNIGTVTQGAAGINPWPIAGPGALLKLSGQVALEGNNTLITPAAGKKIRLYYCSYNPVGAVEAAFRFGAAGSLFLRNIIVAAAAGAIIAKDFGDFRYVEGAVDEPLILNLTSAVSCVWNAFYLEI